MTCATIAGMDACLICRQGIADGSRVLIVGEVAGDDDLDIDAQVHLDCVVSNPQAAFGVLQQLNAAPRA